MRSIGRRLTAATTIVVALSVAVGGTAHAWPVTDHSVPGSVVSAYDPTIVRQFSLEMSADDWLTVQSDRMFAVNVRATLSIDGTPLASQVLVRRKSSSPTSVAGAPDKVALKVDLAGVDTNQRWLGVSKLSLEASTNSPVAEGIAWLLHQAASIADGYGVGYDAGLANFINLSVNGSNMGVYVSVENRHKQFLQNRGLWDTGRTWFYKQSTGIIELESGTVGTNSPQAAALCVEPFNVGKACRAPRDAALTNLLAANVDMQTYLTLAAVNAFIGNDDTAHINGNNAYWLDSSLAGRLRRYYPWDLDRALLQTPGLVNRSVFGMGLPPDRRGKMRQTKYEVLILNHKVYRAQYRTILYALTAPGAPLSRDSLLGLLDQLETLLTPYLAADPYFTQQATTASPAAHFAWLREWLGQRTAIVRAQLDANLPSPRR